MLTGVGAGCGVPGSSVWVNRCSAALGRFPLNFLALQLPQGSLWASRSRWQLINSFFLAGEAVREAMQVIRRPRFGQEVRAARC